MSGDMSRPKLMYLARRNPSLSAQQFTPRWRQHGALGMSMPRWKNIWRYIHCDVLPESQSEYDGVGIVWHKSPETRKAHREDMSSQAIMEADERQTFDRLVVNFCALMEEFTMLEPQPNARVKLIRFATSREGVSREDFVSDAAVHAQQVIAAASVTLLRGFVQNHAQPSETGRPWGLAYDYVEELWFDNVQQATRACVALQGLLPRLCGVHEPLAIVTNEVVLYQAHHGAEPKAI